MHTHGRYSSVVAWVPTSGNSVNEFGRRGVGGGGVHTLGGGRVHTLWGGRGTDTCH